MRRRPGTTDTPGGAPEDECMHRSQKWPLMIASKALKASGSDLVDGLHESCKEGVLLGEEGLGLLTGLVVLQVVVGHGDLRPRPVQPLVQRSLKALPALLSDHTEAGLEVAPRMLDALQLRGAQLHHLLLAPQYLSNLAAVLFTEPSDSFWLK